MTEPIAYDEWKQAEHNNAVDSLLAVLAMQRAKYETAGLHDLGRYIENLMVEVEGKYLSC